jgi:IclR family acetate operon transcriptional repressor
VTGIDGRQATNSGSAAKAGDRYSIAVLGKALDLLEALEAEGEPTLTELSARTGIPKPTALRVLANLEARDYVYRDVHGRYRLGLRLLQLGTHVTDRIDLRTLALPVMERLRDACNETVNLALPAETGIVYIEIMQSAHGLRTAASVGMLDPYHSSALGKAILAQAPDERIDDILGNEPLPRRTSRTLVTRADLEHELAHIRRQGYAIDEEENEIGARCIGAPIFDHRGVCVGAISVSGPATRLTSERAGPISTRVIEAAAAISKRLGYRPADAPTRKSTDGNGRNR